MSTETGSDFSADRPLMTLRVSRDSGRSWELARAVFGADDLAPLVTSEWPPCQCLRCAARAKRSDR
ncbi:hypothetical protein OH768_33180 [Streptomyces sp. NBC_01622]|uniref:hypothetical protein n=1 Tax=Streptomyces sp. NBC_01622 TaxID=2975903 RepID=UPI0038640D39|nr:hypothetical protein OH768_33180 [Streptomyces sp. NBC_01622]